MSPNNSRRAKLIAGAAAGCLILFLALLFVWVLHVPRTIDVRVAGLSPISNGVLLVSVVLSNGTSRTLNLVDDTAGKPLFLLDVGTGGSPPGSGSYGVWLGDMANKLRVNLAPGASLTNGVWMTNPPPRFRLRVNVRDLAAEGRGFPAYHIVGKTLAMKLVQWRQRMHSPDVSLPASRWIEPKDYQQ
jgi:hypothetical protein